jgi:hypothetical protein
MPKRRFEERVSQQDSEEDAAALPISLHQMAHEEAQSAEEHIGEPKPQGPRTNDRRSLASVVSWFLYRG